jgi:hypothetical protein
MFVNRLARTAQAAAEADGRKIVSYKDVAAVVAQDDAMHFLQGMWAHPTRVMLLCSPVGGHATRCDAMRPVVRLVCSVFGMNAPGAAQHESTPGVRSHADIVPERVTAAEALRMYADSSGTFDVTFHSDTRHILLAVSSWFEHKRCF